MGVNGFCKTGIVKNSSFSEPESYIVASSGWKSYTPTKDGVNSCISAMLPRLSPSTSYVIEGDIVWGGGFDSSSTAGTFRLYLQGSVYNTDKGAFEWGAIGNNAVFAIGPAVTGKDVTLTSLLTSNTAGIRHFCVPFTTQSNCGGYEIGMRADYSNGKGWIAYDNLKIYEQKHYVGNLGEKLKLFDSEALSKDFIEY